MATGGDKKGWTGEEKIDRVDRWLKPAQCFLTGAHDATLSEEVEDITMGV